MNLANRRTGLGALTAPNVFLRYKGTTLRGVASPTDATEFTRVPTVDVTTIGGFA